MEARWGCWPQQGAIPLNANSLQNPMDLIIRRAALQGREGLHDVGIRGDRIAAIAPQIPDRAPPPHEPPPPRAAAPAPPAPPAPPLPPGAAARGTARRGGPRPPPPPPPPPPAGGGRGPRPGGVPPRG